MPLLKTNVLQVARDDILGSSANDRLGRATELYARVELRIVHAYGRLGGHWGAVRRGGGRRAAEVGRESVERLLTDGRSTIDEIVTRVGDQWQADGAQ